MMFNWKAPILDPIVDVSYETDNGYSGNNRIRECHRDAEAQPYSQHLLMNRLFIEADNREILLLTSLKKVSFSH